MQYTLIQCKGDQIVDQYTITAPSTWNAFNIADTYLLHGHHLYMIGDADTITDPDLAGDVWVWGRRWIDRGADDRLAAKGIVDRWYHDGWHRIMTYRGGVDQCRPVLRWMLGLAS